MNKMSAEDIAKLKAVALYVLDKCGETDFIHLFKIIYFAERNLYAKYGEGFDAPPTLERSGSEHRREVTSFPFREGKAWLGCGALLAGETER